MLPRREFLGAIGSCFAFTGSLSLLAPPFGSGTSGPPAISRLPVGENEKNGENAELKWDSVVIDTLPHNDAYRCPVITHVNFQQRGNLIAVVGDDHIVSLYSRDDHAFVEHIRRHRDWVRCCEFAPNGELLATAGNDRMLYLWKTGQWVDPFQMKRSTHAIIDLAFSPDGSRIAVVGFGSQLSIYEVANGRLIEELECPCEDMHAVAFSPDGKSMAAGGRNGQIRVWNCANWQQTSQFQVHTKRVRSVEFANTGELISAGDDQLVCLTDPQNPLGGRSLPRFAAKLYATKVLNNELLATAGSDNLIRIWQMSDLQKVSTLKGHTGTVTSLDFSRDQLISGSYDTRLRVWTPEQGTAGDLLRQRTTDRNQEWSPPNFK